MAWRSVHISNPARLNCADGQIVIQQDQGQVTIPIEDVACLILDTPQVSLTGALLSDCMQLGVVILIPDGSHHPAGLALPFHRHHAQAHVAHQQIAISQPLKKRLWQRLVMAKIANQSAVLMGHAPKQAAILGEMIRQVGSGDPDNREAQAARLYWSHWQDDFIRSDDNDLRNARLNYGYAVVRAALARAVVASGLLPAFGLFHSSKSNAFNLVDDLIEPFRPFVDRLVRDDLPPLTSPQLSLDDRRLLAGILTCPCRMGTEQVTILAASEMIADSLVQCLDRNSAALLRLPKLDPAQLDPT